MMGSGLEYRRKLIREKDLWERLTTAEMIGSHQAAARAVWVVD